MAQKAGKGGGPSPKGLGGAVGGLLLLGGAAVVASNSLFNVDGGHRAIKYTRIGGVTKEIYSEGTYSNLNGGKLWMATNFQPSQVHISRSHGSRRP
jgi:hypothetical protein